MIITSPLYLLVECHCIHLQLQLVGSDQMSRTDVDNVFRDYGQYIGQIVTPTTVYRFSRSRYGSRKSSTLQFATHPQAKYIRSGTLQV